MGELEDLFIRNLQKAVFALLSWLQHNHRDGEVVYLKPSRRCFSVLASHSRLSWDLWQEEDQYVSPGLFFSSAVKLSEIEICIYAKCTFLVCMCPFCRMHTSSFWVIDATLVQGWFILLEVRLLFCVVLIFFTSVALNHFLVVPGALDPGALTSSLLFL